MPADGRLDEVCRDCAHPPVTRISRFFS